MKTVFCKLCQSFQTVCSNFMKISYTCRKFLHFRKYGEILTKVVLIVQYPPSLKIFFSYLHVHVYTYMRTCSIYTVQWGEVDVQLYTAGPVCRKRNLPVAPALSESLGKVHISLSQSLASSAGTLTQSSPSAL